MWIINAQVETTETGGVGTNAEDWTRHVQVPEFYISREDAPTREDALRIALAIVNPAGLVPDGRVHVYAIGTNRGDRGRMAGPPAPIPVGADGKQDLMETFQPALDEFVLSEFPTANPQNTETFDNAWELARYLSGLGYSQSRQWEILHVRRGRIIARYWPATVVRGADL